MKTEKLFIHEHPPGSGKTHSIVDVINHFDSSEFIVYAVPTLVLAHEIGKKLDCLVITSETPSRKQTVTQWIAENYETISSSRVILTTHSTLLNNLPSFHHRHLFIDELPLEVLKFETMWTSLEDAGQLNLLLGNQPLVEKRIEEYRQGSSELSQEKFALLKASISDSFAIEKVTGKEKCAFHYAAFCEPREFDGFLSIHIMGATVRNTMPYAFFTSKLMCGYDECDSTFLNVRGNKMDNPVTIYPLLKFNDRDFISKPILESNFDAMVETVKANTKSRVITVTNDSKKKAFREPLELIPTFAHGLNAYSHMTEAAIIYSANPNPYVIPFMEKCSIAMGLDADYLMNAYIEQNFLDVVYQAVTRTAVRVHDSKEPCRFFVPDMRSAKWLSERFSNAIIDDSIAIQVEIDKGGAKVGNTNKQGKGCPIVKDLISHYHVNAMKASRIIKKFELVNHCKADHNNPVHMLRIKKAACMKSLKGFCFDIRLNADGSENVKNGSSIEQLSADSVAFSDLSKC
ncbi:hypothetical protein [Vibrio harveyi]|uniref:hypothetical protein n=1 Tax=Vibrio harveyi TaxID=669 RepID=UPI003CF79830